MPCWKLVLHIVLNIVDCVLCLAKRANAKAYIYYAYTIGHIRSDWTNEMNVIYTHLFAHRRAGAQFNYTLSKILPFIIISHVLRMFYLVVMWMRRGDSPIRWPAMVWCWWRFVVFCVYTIFVGSKFSLCCSLLFFFTIYRRAIWQNGLGRVLNVWTVKSTPMLLAIRTHIISMSMKLFEFKCPTIMLLIS